MTCPNGHAVSDGQRFCPDCGEGIAADPQRPQDPATDEASAPTEGTTGERTVGSPSGKRSRKPLWVTALALTALLGTGGALVLASTRGEKDRQETASAKPGTGGECPAASPVKELQLREVKARTSGSGVYLDPNDTLRIGPGEEYYDDVAADACLKSDQADPGSALALASLLHNVPVSWRATACGLRATSIVYVIRDQPSLSEQAFALGSTQPDGDDLTAVARDMLVRDAVGPAPDSPTFVQTTQREQREARTSCAGRLGETSPAATSTPTGAAPALTPSTSPEGDPAGDGDGSTACTPSSCGDNGISFTHLYEEIKREVGQQKSVTVEDVNCDGGDAPPNRVAVGATFDCVLTGSSGDGGIAQVTVLDSPPYYRWILKSYEYSSGFEEAE